MLLLSAKDDEVASTLGGHETHKGLFMLRIFLFIFSIALISGCGAGDEDKPDERPPTIEVVDRDVQYLDSYWLPGGRNYAVHENSLAISHNAGVSLLDINESGLVESEIQVSSTGSINIATLENGDIATLMVNHVRVNRIESDMFDVIYMTEDSPDLSAVIFESFGNCAYWVDKSSPDEVQRYTIKEVCVDSQGLTTQDIRYQTENWINNVYALEDGSIVVFESLGGPQKISLLSSEFELLDEYTTTDKLYGFDIELRDDTLFFTGFATVWKMGVSFNGLSEPKLFHETVNPTSSNGTNRVAVHDKGVLLANNNFIYAYNLNGDDVTEIYRIDVEKTIEALVVYKNFLIVSYWDNVDFEIYRISDLI
ncbi:hypothetical protein EGC76_07175 [Pseudidiomarina gelatinasegens]|uniref:WD40 repeat domain-containing protein n=1 Tax=Pseudidiomarina gelatinasegens TaxID=2487740 RepID=A0A451GEC7_9GAMM|nr:hypothetical protein [Pseudidiomarina gelatinasegens]RWU11312.1 hypothetical protein EGC76_07175 [Pseudidiomarina gelatinasegens]